MSALGFTRHIVKVRSRRHKQEVPLNGMHLLCDGGGAGLLSASPSALRCLAVNRTSLKVSDAGERE